MRDVNMLNSSKIMNVIFNLNSSIKNYERNITINKLIYTYVITIWYLFSLESGVKDQERVEIIVLFFDEDFYCH